jgi:hypothetical protein
MGLSKLWKPEAYEGEEEKSYFRVRFTKGKLESRLEKE